MSEEPTDEEKILYFEERNKDQNESIIFLHGGGGSHVEWKLVAPQQSLSSHHLILVDLPMHSGSWDIGRPLTLASAADEVCKVIQKHAHGGKAHVVGLSLGGFIALVLTSRHPEVLLSTFATGAYPYRGMFKWFMEHPMAMSIANCIQNIPGVLEVSLRWQGIDYEEWLAETKKNTSPERGNSAERSKAMNKELSAFSMEDVKAVAYSGVRTCVIAGGKMDQIDPVRDMGVVLREGGQKKGVKNEAVVVRDAYHPWHLQLPELFAAGIAAWVQEKELPKEFEIL
ncbi:AB hydrolase superfamily yvaM [Fusarium subglutinans]|uniref:AB hydrolase superfamily yvaM n=1 Tax=Gibberella subglutinans TaxID=42677 RepID=A0A8H5Q6T9_GIBSU|nr:AB hydrolase superfamily yvaM [Fusarium subglutinans]KAF5608573.1 AB hydrolase superfamily yvaM [Fusarium subglutinans]